MQRVAKKSKDSRLSALAMSFVLPHENRPMRLPVVPACLTAILSGMAEATVPIADGTSKRAFLCRDPCYPLWMDRTVVNMSAALGAILQQIPANENNRSLPTPSFDAIKGARGTPCTIDGVAVINDDDAVAKGMILGRGVGNPCIYIPPDSWFEICCDVAVTATGFLEAELVYYGSGDEFVTTVRLDPTGNYFRYVGKAGGTTTNMGLVLEGRIPSGFCYMRALRIGVIYLTTPSTGSPALFMGWHTGGSIVTPSGTATLMLPYAQPVEFNNSRIPYQRTRLNSSAALFTNVTAALSKEGTILAARLKANLVDPWSFGSSNIDSVHPSLRYFGPLEKGLYTFTTPSGNLDDFDDHVHTLTALTTSVYLIPDRPIFDFMNVGVYNAMIMSDLGSSTSGTQLAVSQYVHLEFETTSSLFNLGVSMQTLEALHATEVALLKFGHFHENPLHWAALKAAATAALRIVGPMVAPVVEHYAQKVVQKGVDYLRGTKPAGDRTMQQASLQPARKSAQPKPRAKRHGKKR